MRAFKQHALAGLQGLVDQERRVGRVRLESLRVDRDLVADRVRIERSLVAAAQDLAVADCEGRSDLLLQDAEVEEVLDADTDARRLVCVSRANAATRRADLQRTEADLVLRVEQAVPGHDHVRIHRDAQTSRRAPTRLERVELSTEHLGINYNAVAEDANLVGLEDAAGQQMELEGLIAMHDRVARIVATLVARHDLESLSEQVDDLAFALIAPLGSNNHCSAHLRLSPCKIRERREVRHEREVHPTNSAVTVLRHDQLGNSGLF